MATLTPEQLAEIRKEFEQYAAPAERKEGDIDSEMFAEACGLSRSRANEKMREVIKKQPDKYQMVRVRDGKTFCNVLRRVHMRQMD